MPLEPSETRARSNLDFSQSPIFSWDRLDMQRLTVTGILIFKSTEGVGVGDYSSGGLGGGGGEGREKWRDCNNITAARVHGARCTSNAGILLVIRE